MRLIRNGPGVSAGQRPRPAGCALGGAGLLGGYFRALSGRLLSLERVTVNQDTQNMEVSDDTKECKEMVYVDG